eukprot:m.67970 g.67970  ORF g.67970 m.67970 type:complete len:57 (-) comp12181_c0_seq6:250-420(-)
MASFIQRVRGKSQGKKGQGVVSGFNTEDAIALQRYRAEQGACMYCMHAFCLLLTSF